MMSALVQESKPTYNGNHSLLFWDLSSSVAPLLAFYLCDVSRHASIIWMLLP